MLVGRVVNFLVPLVFAQLVRIFEEGSQTSPWPYLGAYVALRFLQATGGLAALRDVSRVNFTCIYHALMCFGTDSLDSSHAILRQRYIGSYFAIFCVMSHTSSEMSQL